MNDNWMTMVAMKWQAMETSPKDGSHILVAVPDLKFPVSASWQKNSAGGSGWACDEILDWVEPTHWMPLPKLPYSLKKSTTKEGQAHEAKADHIPDVTKMVPQITDLLADLKGVEETETDQAYNEGVDECIGALQHYFSGEICPNKDALQNATPAKEAVDYEQ